MPTRTASAPKEDTKKSSLRKGLDAILEEAGVLDKVVEVVEKDMTVEGSKVKACIAELPSAAEVKEALYTFMTTDKKIGSNINVDVTKNPHAIAYMRFSE